MTASPRIFFPSRSRSSAGLNESGADVSPEPKAFLAWFKKYKPEVVIGKASFVLPLFRKMGIAVPGDVAFVDVFLEDITAASPG